MANLFRSLSNSRSSTSSSASGINSSEINFPQLEQKDSQLEYSKDIL